jgi:hypothetical protein
MIAFFRVFARIVPIEKAPHQRKLSEAIFRCKVSMRRLPGSLPYLVDLVTRFRSRAAVLQFVRCERGNTSFLIGSDLIRECTGVKMKADNVHLLVDGGGTWFRR